MKTKLVYSFFLILFLFMLTACGDRKNNENNSKVDNDELNFNYSEECQKASGTWLVQFSECEYIDKEWCESRKGDFKECESACRHNVTADYCTLQCVPVCLFSLDDEKSTASLGDTKFLLEGEVIKLANGSYEKESIPDGVSKTIIKIFEAKPIGDFNGDGLEDVAVILQKDSGGSGVFYYIALAMRGRGIYSGTNAVLLGDRIEPQSIEMKNNGIIVNYADREPGESFVVPPSLNVSKYFIIDNGLLIEKQ